MKILVINTGSSSLKFWLFDMDSGREIASGGAPCFGAGCVLNYTVKEVQQPPEHIALETHGQAISAVLQTLTNRKRGVIGSLNEIDAVGHKVAHGGRYFAKSVIINDEALRNIEACTPLAPRLNPVALSGIKFCREVLGDIVKQVAVFDTAFHRTIPDEASIYAIPGKYRDKYGIRRYGFHGISHRYVALRAAKILGREQSDIRIISCHLDSGSSITAIAGGRSVDTTMGFTPLEGLVMGSRSGSIDPAIIPFLAEVENLSNRDINIMLNQKSGLLALSGISADFHDIERAALGGSAAAAGAIEQLAYQIKKTIGAYTAAMGNLDALVFTAGIGENSAGLRSLATGGLECFGIKLDRKKNSSCCGECNISAGDSLVQTLVIPANEEWMIARDTMDLCIGNL